MKARGRRMRKGRGRDGRKEVELEGGRKKGWQHSEHRASEHKCAKLKFYDGEVIRKKYLRSLLTRTIMKTRLRNTVQDNLAKSLFAEKVSSVLHNFQSFLMEQRTNRKSDIYCLKLFSCYAKWSSQEPPDVVIIRKIFTVHI